MTVSLLENQKYVMDQNVQYFEYIIFSAQNVGIDIFLILYVSLYPQPNFISCSVET